MHSAWYENDSESQKIPDRVGDIRRLILLGLTTSAESLAYLGYEDVEDTERKKRHDDRSERPGNESSNRVQSTARHIVQCSSERHRRMNDVLKVRHTVRTPTV